MLFAKKSLEIPTADEALKGRAEPIPTAATHFVNGHALAGPYPEGLETALSATALFGLPCWATLGTERFRLVSLPPQVTRLVLFLDNDRGGRRAEALAREAFAYLAVEVRYPRRRGTDWNDVLCAGSAPSPDRRSTGPARADSLKLSRRRG